MEHSDDFLMISLLIGFRCSVNETEISHIIITEIVNFLFLYKVPVHCLQLIQIFILMEFFCLFV